MNPFRISVYDKDFDPMDWVGAPLELHLTLRDDEASIATLVVDDDDEQVGVLTAAGARLVIEYQYDPADPSLWKTLISGAIGERLGEDSPAGQRTFAVDDDWAYVLAILGWPNPGGAISAQGAADAYATYTGPAETVVKDAISDNATRLGLPVTVAADGAAGDTITVALRMHPLKDRLFPAVTQAGVVVTAIQSGSSILVDCHEPQVLTEPLTQSSGIVQSGALTVSPPLLTRVIVGGQGEGTAREFRRVINTSVESDWGLVREGFVDARDTDDTAAMDARAWEALNEGAPVAGVSASLAETDDFRFGVTFDVGDVVPIQLDNAPLVTDRVREVQIDWTADDGLVITPKVGDVATSFEETAAAAIDRVARQSRNQDVRS